MSEYILVHLTTSSAIEAKKIINALLGKKLIACATIIPSVTSLYLWKGEIEEEKEVAIEIKTKDVLFNKVCSLIENLHSYQTPQILKIPILDPTLSSSFFKKSILSNPGFRKRLYINNLRDEFHFYNFFIHLKVKKSNYF